MLSKTTLVLSLMISAAPSLAQSVSNPAQGGCNISGPQNAPVPIVEFVDFRCKYCKMGATTMKRVLKDYRRDVRLILRNLPLEIHEPNSLTAAKAFAAVCMQSPVLAYAFQDQLFMYQNEFNEKGDPFLFELANDLGVNVTQMTLDMESPTVANSLAADRQLAASFHFGGTPAFLIGSKPLMGARPYSQFKKIIEAQLGR